MKKKLFGALEELDDLDTTDVTELPDADDIKDDDKVMEETMQLVMEEEAEYENEIEDLDEIYEDLDDVDEAVERLEILVEAIKKYGISAPMMEMADPNGELVAAGLCCAYEELSDIPEKGEIADAAIEAIGSKITETAKKLAGTAGTAASVAGSKIAGAASKAAGAAGAKIAKTSTGLIARAELASIVGIGTTGIAAVIGAAATAAALIKLALIIKATMETRKKGLAAFKAKLAAAKAFDEEKFGKKSAKVFTKAQYGDAIKASEHVLKVVNSSALQKIADELSTAMNGSSISTDKVKAILKKADPILKSLDSDSNVKDILGLTVTFGEDSISASSKGATIKAAKGDLGSLGWKAADATHAIDAAGKITAEAEVISGHVKATADTCKKAIDGLKKNLKKDKEIAIDERNGYKEAIVQLLAIVKANKSVANSAVSAIFKVNATAVAVAKAALSSQTKEA